MINIAQAQWGEGMNSQYPRVRSFGLFINILIVIGAVLLIPRISALGANLIDPFSAGIDPNGSFSWLVIHHAIQLTLTIMLMLVLSNGQLSLWGFNFDRWKTSLMFIVGLVMVFGAAEYFRISSGGSSAFDAPRVAPDMLGVQGFQYIMSGLGEEPLFRAFIIVFLARVIPQIIRLGELEIPATVLVATGLFMFAHIQIDYAQFAIVHADLGQQLKALQFGLLYGIAFHYTRSLLAPIVMHGISNGLPMSIELYFT